MLESSNCSNFVRKRFSMGRDPILAIHRKCQLILIISELWQMRHVEVIPRPHASVREVFQFILGIIDINIWYKPNLYMVVIQIKVRVNRLCNLYSAKKSTFYG